MSESISHSEYKEIIYYRQKSAILCTWLSPTEYMDEDTYKAEMLDFLSALKKNNPKNVIHNLQDFKFPLTPELQTWVDNNINRDGYQAGVRNAYFVVSPDIFAQISVEQAMEEADGSVFNIAYVENLEDALAKI